MKLDDEVVEMGEMGLFAEAGPWGGLETGVGTAADADPTDKGMFWEALRGLWRGGVFGWNGDWRHIPEAYVETSTAELDRTVGTGAGVAYAVEVGIGAAADLASGTVTRPSMGVTGGASEFGGETAGVGEEAPLATFGGDALGFATRRITAVPLVGEVFAVVVEDIGRAEGLG